MDGIHAALDAGGLAPGVGIIPDALNALIYAIEGDKVNAAISAAAMIPVVGQSATAAKYAAKAAETVKGISNIEKVTQTATEAEKVTEIAKDTETITDVVKEADRKVASETVDSALHTVTEHYGSNEAVWTLDASGRPVSVEARLDSTYKTARSSAEKEIQGSVGGDARLVDDDGGHMIGHRFMSDQGEKNLFPQNSNLNRSAYKKMENEWADWTAEGFEVKLKVKLEPPESSRPDSIIAKYEIYNPKTKQRVLKRKYNFKNQSGESFKRVKKSEMKRYM